MADSTDDVRQAAAEVKDAATELGEAADHLRDAVSPEPEPEDAESADIGGYYDGGGAPSIDETTGSGGYDDPGPR